MDNNLQQQNGEVLNKDILEAIGVFSAKMDEEFTGLKTDVTSLKTDVTGLKIEVGDLRSEMEQGFADVRTEMDQGFASIRAEIRELRNDFEKLEKKVDQINARTMEDEGVFGKDVLILQKQVRMMNQRIRRLEMAHG